MTKHFLLIFLCVSAMFLVSGCNQGPLKPEGLPDLIAGAQIEVIQDGKPLQGADVTLIPLDTSLARWLVKGKTGANGIAKMMTYGKFAGSPAGKFKVVVVKREYLPSKQQKPQAEGEVYQGELKEELGYIDYVDQTFGRSEKTTIEVEISSGSPKHTVDVGKAVRVEGKE